MIDTYKKNHSIHRLAQNILNHKFIILTEKMLERTQISFKI